MLTKVGKGSEVATSVLGVPITYNDDVERKIIWTKSTEYDENGEANIRDKRSSNTLTMPVDFDFTQREYTLKFYDFGDILAKIGGLRASIMPFFLFFAPLLVLYFLIELAKITKTNTEKQATDECRQLCEFSFKQFKIILEKTAKGDDLVAEDVKVALTSVLETNKIEKLDSEQLKALAEECLVLRDRMVSTKIT